MKCLFLCLSVHSVKAFWPVAYGKIVLVFRSPTLFKQTAMLLHCCQPLCSSFAHTSAIQQVDQMPLKHSLPLVHTPHFLCQLPRAWTFPALTFK